jgi:hypothetical protein
MENKHKNAKKQIKEKTKISTKGQNSITINMTETSPETSAAATPRRIAGQ